MAKKRKSSARQRDTLQEFKASDSMLGPVHSYEDVADSEDEFHINRDKVSLEDGPDVKRRRRIAEEDALLEPSDEEILGYSSESDGDFDEDDEDDIPKNEISKNGAVSDSEAAELDDEDAGGWGASKRDYYNADNIETEADALEEEAEAKRLQQKKLQKMSEADFGFDESEWLEVPNDGDAGNIVTEVLKDVEIMPEMSNSERLDLLRRRYPEFESLADEFLQLHPVLQELQVEAGRVEHSKIPKPKSTRLAIAKCRALAAYMGALSMYFGVLTSTAKVGGVAIDPLELRDHSVMESLLLCRELWSKIKTVTVPVDIQPEENIATAEVDNSPANGDQIGTPVQSSEIRKSKKQHAREKAVFEAAQSRLERIRVAEEGFQDLALLIPESKNHTRSTAPEPIAERADSDSDFGEEESLSASALAEKAAKRRSLRFYTSQITQKANKRAGAGRDAGGDADIPRRERLRDRRDRLNAEAEARGKKLDSYGRGHSGAGATLGADNDSAAGSETELANAVRGDEDEYYDMVAQVSRKRKDEKAERYAAIAEAKAVGKQVRIVEEMDVEGKRAISYQIEKNKGLAPKRRKEIRNPRVKKRKKYEEKMKKLSSIRAVYKGGEGRGGYGGEKTGIKTGLVKSIKL